VLAHLVVDIARMTGPADVSGALGAQRPKGQAKPPRLKQGRHRELNLADYLFIRGSRCRERRLDVGALCGVEHRLPVEIDRRMITAELKQLFCRPVQFDDAAMLIDAPDRHIDRIEQRPGPDLS